MTTPANTGLQEGGSGEATLAPGAGSGGGSEKMQAVADIVKLISTLPASDINGFRASLAKFEPKFATDVSDEANRSSIAAKPSAASMKGMVKEDLKALFGTEETISEEFMDRATTLFEAAVSTRVGIETIDLEEHFETLMTEKTDVLVQQFTERLDSYLDYIAEEWLDQNKLAVEKGIRTELSENFLQGLHTLFSESYVTVPDDKIDVVEGLTDEVAELRKKIATIEESRDEVAGLAESLIAGNILRESSVGLTEADADRLATLVEDVEFTDSDAFASKVKLLKESFLKPAGRGIVRPSGLILESDGSREQGNNAKADPRMSAYASAISDTIRK